MPSLLSRYQHDASPSSKQLALPLTLLITSVLAYIGTPIKHSLLTSAAAWTGVIIYTSLKSSGGKQSLFNVTPARKLAWTAGGLFALARVCERAVDGRGIWWAQVGSHSYVERVKEL